MTEDRSSQRPAEEHLIALPAGFRLGRYELQAVLGQGGFGITYRALDLELNRSVAIKESLPSDVAVRVDGTTIRAKTSADQESFAWGLSRFLDEARALARFDEAPSIVRVHDYMQDNGTAYMVMALIDGEPLSRHFRNTERRVAIDLGRLLPPLLDGLEQVHAAGFLHRDIKPSNILIRANGAPVLIDFGAARQALGERSRSITSIFTPGYAPFEQYMASGHQGPWTDIYALAATAYQGITGTVPPAAPDRLRRDAMVPAAQAGDGLYPAHFLTAIDAGLAVLENARPQSIGEWRSMLLAAPESSAHRADTSRRTLPPSSFDETSDRTRASQGRQNSAPRKRALIAGVLGAGIAVAGGGAYAVWNEIENERRTVAERLKVEAEARAKAEEIAREQARRTEELRRQEEQQRQAAAAAARQKAEEEAKRKQAEALAREQAERDRQEAATKAKLEAEAKARAAEDAKTKAEDERKKKAEAEAKRKADEEPKRTTVVKELRGPEMRDYMRANSLVAVVQGRTLRLTHFMSPYLDRNAVVDERGAPLRQLRWITADDGRYCGYASWASGGFVDCATMELMGNGGWRLRFDAGAVLEGRFVARGFNELPDVPDR